MHHGERTRIAKAVGVSPSFIARMVRGLVSPSPGLAVRLEKETGIDRRAWLWPEEYPNPLIHTEPEDADRQPL
jgi:plasmid maintenance system antidote protein VapI